MVDVTGPGATILPAGPSGPGPLITIEVMGLPAVWMLLGAWMFRGVVHWKQPLGDQPYAAVPTGQPRWSSWRNTSPH